MGAHGDAARFRPLGHAGRQSVIWAAAASLVLVVHGIAHLVGTAQAFDAAGGGHTLAYLGGAWHISLSGALRLIGLAWAITALAYVAVAGAMWFGSRGWWRYAGGVTVCSLILTVAALPETGVGLVVNLMIIGLLIRRPALVSIS